MRDVRGMGCHGHLLSFIVFLRAVRMAEVSLGGAMVVRKEQGALKELEGGLRRLLRCLDWLQENFLEICNISDLQEISLAM